MASIQFERFWNLLYESEINDANLDMKEMRLAKYTLLAIWSNMTGGRHLLGEYRNLAIYSRRQGWAKFHLVLIPKEALTSCRWGIGEQDIIDALYFANEFKYVLTFATYKSGATFPNRVHFQSIPSTIEGNDFGKPKEFTPFQALFEAEGRIVLKKDDYTVQLIMPPNYPILCARIEGKLEEVALKVSCLSTGYDSLRSMNLIIEPLHEREQARLHFFPRRFDGKLFSHLYYGLPIGPFEMGGVFALRGQKRKPIYDRLEPGQLIQALEDVAVVVGSPEETCLLNLIKLL